MTAQRLIERRRVFPPFTVKAAIVAAMIAWHATCGAAAVQIDLPSQPLPSSLAMLAAQTGIEVDVDDALVQGRSSPAVSGMLEPAAALQALLTGADLVAVRGEGGTYAVVAASGAATVERIEVRGRHEREAPASALRMNVPLLDAPLSVQVIDKDTLDLQGVFDPQDALVNVPGAVRASSFTGLGETFLLRGLRAAGSRQGRFPRRRSRHRQHQRDRPDRHGEHRQYRGRQGTDRRAVRSRRAGRHRQLRHAQTDVREHPRHRAALRQ
jgi:hypothetical protein